MVTADLPWIHAKRSRHGKLRYYFRRSGFPRVRLKGSPGSREFHDAYNACLKTAKLPAAAPTRMEAPGTVTALVIEYMASADFKGLAKTTRRECGYVLDSLVKNFGTGPVKLLERQHIARWRDAMQDKPGAANKMLRYLSVLMSFAIERGYRNDNPVLRMKKLKVGEFRPWTPAERAAFEARWTIGTLERLGYCLALYLGQRRHDLVSLTYASVASGYFVIRQHKTGKELKIPIHPELKKALPTIHPNDATPILCKKDRSPFSPVYFGHLMARAIDAAGLPNDCVLHGLRKSAAVALIEAGCTLHQAASITGQTLRMLEFYAKGHDQAKLAKEAMDLWSQTP